MLSLALERTTITCLFEAVRTVLDEVGRRQVESIRGGEDVEFKRKLASLYGHARRIRDYLQRINSPTSGKITVELTPEDGDLLASCAVHEIGRIEASIKNHPPRNATEARWLNEKRDTLAGLTDQLATRQIQRIPIGDPMELMTPTVRSLLTRVRSRSVTEAVQKGQLGLTEIFSQTGAVPGAFGLPRHGVAPSLAGQPLPTGTGSVAAALTPTGDEPANAPVPEPPSVEVTFAQSPPPPVVVESPFDVRRMRDARLRTIAEADQAGHERAVRAGDWRMAVVHAASMLEALLVDAALPRAQGLGLRGTPDMWQLQTLLEKLLGDQIPINDRAFALQLATVRNVLRPATQIHAPVVVGESTWQQADALLRRVASSLGLDAESSLPLPV